MRAFQWVVAKAAENCLGSLYRCAPTPWQAARFRITAAANGQCPAGTGFLQGIGCLGLGHGVWPNPGDGGVVGSEGCPGGGCVGSSGPGGAIGPSGCEGLGGASGWDGLGGASGAGGCAGGSGWSGILGSPCTGTP